MLIFLAYGFCTAHCFVAQATQTAQTYTTCRFLNGACEGVFEKNTSAETTSVYVGCSTDTDKMTSFGSTPSKRTDGIKMAHLHFYIHSVCILWHVFPFITPFNRFFYIINAPVHKVQQSVTRRRMSTKDWNYPCCVFLSCSTCVVTLFVFFHVSGDSGVKCWPVYICQI